jgi:hypothetical protein
MSTEELPAPEDWRGTPIDIDTIVIWKASQSVGGLWKIGRVVELALPEYPSGYSPWDLTIEWLEESRTYGDSTHKARGVKPYHVTVWPGSIEIADPPVSFIPAQRNPADPE